MKFLITNIKYSIKQEDIDDYRKYEDIDDKVTDEEIRKEIQRYLPQHLVVEVDNYSDDYEEEMTNAVSSTAGWCVEEFTEQSLLDFLITFMSIYQQKKSQIKS